MGDIILQIEKKLIKLGRCVALTIPKEMCDITNLDVGTMVSLVAENDIITINHMVIPQEETNNIDVEGITSNTEDVTTETNTIDIEALIKAKLEELRPNY